MFILFLMLWLISPIVLLILFLVQISKTSDLKRQNRELIEKLRQLSGENAANSPEASCSAIPTPDPVQDHVPDPQAPTEISTPDPAENPVPDPQAQTAISAPEPETGSAQNTTIVPQAEAAPAPVPAPQAAPFPYDMPYLAQLPPQMYPQMPVNSAGADSGTVPGTALQYGEYPAAASGAAVPYQNIPAAAASEKKSVSTINIILILGALLISLAGFIFASATWDSLNMFFKTALLLSFSVVFFGIHWLAERKLKLEQTGRIFYILGSIFLPAAIAAAGALNVFGEFFSFSGEGRAAVFSAMFFSVCVPFFKGAHDYKFRSFAAVSFASFSASAVALMWQLSPGGDLTALLMSVFALIVIMTESLTVKLFSALFGEESVFIPEWRRFSTLNTWVLSVISLFATETGFISLAAFAIFSVCFLKKTLTDKNGTAGTLAFAFFIAASLFTGFDPGETAEYTIIIAAVSLIYAVLSAMGLFPDTVRLIMRILAMTAAGIAAFMGIIENIILIAENEIPSLTLIFAAAAVFAQLLILTLRNKTSEFKAMSFGAMLWLSAEITLFISGNLGGGSYTFAAAYGFMLIYFVVTRSTGLRERLYASANDITMAVYAFICAEICTSSADAVTGGIIGVSILLAGILLSASSGHKSFSPVICPTLTGLLFFPLGEIFRKAGMNVLHVNSVSGGIILMLICFAASVLLFIPKAEKYALSYGIGTIAFVLVFTLISLIESTSYFVPMLVAVAYSAVYMLRYAIPKEKYSHIIIIHSAIVYTSFFVGRYFTDSVYLLCFPAVVLMLIFAVYVISSSMLEFEKTGKYSEQFLWFALPVFSGILMIFAEVNKNFPLMIFGIVLLVCSVFASMFRKNTMNLIFPLFTAFAVLSRTHTGDNGTAAAIAAAILAASGRLMFSRKLFEKLYSDVLSISAAAFCCIFIAKEDSDLNLWIGIILLAASIANLIRPGHSPRSNRGILITTAAFIFPVWWTIPFFDVPDLIALEWSLLPAVIFCVILRLILRESPEKAYNFSFVTAIVCLAILFIGALSTGESFDSVFIGVVLLIMLAVSFIIKRKRWFVLAVTSMVISAVLLSIRQLDSIAWLVYLVLTGAALITLGVVNEIKKQQKRSGEETKLTRFMSDWTW